MANVKHLINRGIGYSPGGPDFIVLTGLSPTGITPIVGTLPAWEVEADSPAMDAFVQGGPITATLATWEVEADLPAMEAIAVAAIVGTLTSAEVEADSPVMEAIAVPAIIATLTAAEVEADLPVMNAFVQGGPLTGTLSTAEVESDSPVMTAIYDIFAEFPLVTAEAEPLFMQAVIGISPSIVDAENRQILTPGAVAARIVTAKAVSRVIK